MKRPYTFQFNIADEVEGVRFAQVGQGDEQGNVQGSYSYVRPDGVLVTVTYIADKNGFHPEIIEEPAPHFEKNPLGTSKHSVLLPFAEEFVIEVTGDQLKGYREQAAAQQAQQIQLGQQRPN
ncbi:Cuticle protein 10.9-like [Homarus americanus]|uniref:Cuticle protein 10.9-like n=1 Tax=Homarus americanus TaxID=6706 RepID=A0A8J5TUX9_HOMAM|nr:Cuticle protein 10.9-like [Homarus americanus]